MKDRSRTAMSLPALVAVLLWATTFCGSRLLTPKLGTLTTGAAIFGLAGVVGCLPLLLSRAARQTIARMDRRYLLVCGGLFVAYTMCLYLAIGLAGDDRKVLEVGVINYLWPGLTLAMSVPLLKARARLPLAVGLAVAVAGAAMCASPEQSLNVSTFLADMHDNAVPYLLAFGAATTWALYCNFNRLLARPGQGGATPLFILAGGLAMGVLAVIFGASPQWSADLLAPLVFMALGPSLIAYVLWDLATRRGNVTLCAIFAYATPLLAAVITCLLFKITPTAIFWVGCSLVVAGAILCRLGISENPDL